MEAAAVSLHLATVTAISLISVMPWLWLSSLPFASHPFYLREMCEWLIFINFSCGNRISASVCSMSSIRTGSSAKYSYGKTRLKLRLIKSFSTTKGSWWVAPDGSLTGFPVMLTVGLLILEKFARLFCTM